jgi:hypothetical protein
MTAPKGKKGKKEENIKSKSFVGTKLHPHGNYESYDLTLEEELKEVLAPRLDF